MKRALTLVALAAVVIAPVAGHAAPKPPKKTTRVVKFDYQAFCSLTTPAALLGPNACPLPGEFEVVLTKAEHYVSWSAEDATGTPVPFQWWLNGDYPSVQSKCGPGKYTSKKGGGSLTFSQAPDPAGCQGLPTEGTLTVTITNIP